MPHIKRTRSTRRSVRTSTGTRPSTDHGGGTRCESFFDLLWAYEVYVGVDGAGCYDVFFAGDDFGRGADGEGWVDVGHDVWVACFSDADDESVLDADVCLGAG